MRLTECGWRQWVILLFAGSLSSLGHAPFSLPILTLAGFAIAYFIFLECRSVRHSVVCGWLFGAGYFGISLSWIVEPFLVNISRDGWMAPFAIFGAAGGMAILWGLAFAIAYWLSSSTVTRVLSLSVAITLMGLIREVALTGFPWALPSYVWSETPVAQSLAWIGPHGLTFLTVLASGMWLIFNRAWTGVIGTVILISVLWAAGEARIASTQETFERPPIIRVVQPNVPQLEKWNRNYSNVHFAKLLELTASNSDVDIDAIVWPETAATFLLMEGDERLRAIADASNGKPAVIGIRRWDGTNQYNSLAVIGAGGSIDGVYDKQKLVPFGEYLPFSRWFKVLGMEGLTTRFLNEFKPGETERILNIENVGNYLALICYESIFPRDVRRAARSNGMLQVTNDGWFGTFSGPQQHFIQGRMRSIENGLPLIRSANTGISAVIDGKGQVIKQLPLGEQGFIDVPLPMPIPPTLYSRVGDRPILIVIVALAVYLGIRRRRNLH